MVRPRILILSTFLLNDRMILYNDFLPVLEKDADVHIWPLAWDKPAYQNLNYKNVKIEKFPEVLPMRMKRVYLRRLVDYSWDAKKLSVSRGSFWKHSVAKTVSPLVKIIYSAGKIVNALGFSAQLEKIAEKYLVSETRSPEAYARLKELKPDMVVTMAPMFSIEPGIICEARKLNIPCVAFITSWDNLTTKNRMSFSYEGFVLWANQMKADLSRMFPQYSKKPYYIVGAPQYDVFKNPEYELTREEFCRQNNLDPSLPIILYALGSPNMFDEFPGAREFVNRAATGVMGNIQVIVRPHPMKFNDPGLLEIPNLYDKAFIQTSNPKKGEKVFTHDKLKIVEWVNTIKHADIVIQLASTIAIDAANLDRPIININFDPSGKQNQLVWELNHIMDHFAPITNANAMWEVQNYEEMVEAVNGYLKNPDLHKEGRKYISDFVCGYLDGKCGERYAKALLDFADKNRN
jgi:hypothetical protein